jgi:hypothetical protein
VFHRCRGRKSAQEWVNERFQIILVAHSDLPSEDAHV